MHFNRMDSKEKIDNDDPLDACAGKIEKGEKQLYYRNAKGNDAIYFVRRKFLWGYERLSKEYQQWRFATARPNFSFNLINPSPTVAIIVETFS